MGELEEHLEEQQEEHNRIVREFQDRITHLEAETQTLQSRCQWLEALLEKERLARDESSRNGSIMSAKLPPQPDQLRMSQLGQHIPNTLGDVDTAGSVLLAEPRPMAQPFSISQIISPPDPAGTPLDLTCGGCEAGGRCACAEEVLRNADIPIGCGGCTLGSRCECLEESIRASTAAGDLKRPHPSGSPSPVAPEEKRQRSDAGLALETDFTAMFTAPTTKEKPLGASLQPQLQFRESCGFCKDGTYCVCADSMVTSTVVSVHLPAPAPIDQPVAQQTRTPPPSENDVVPIPMEVTATGAIKLPGLRSLQHSRSARPPRPASPPTAVGGCGPNGPGTCGQWLTDPKSGLFCRSLAANFDRNSRQQDEPAGGCCGNGGPGGCCKAGKPGAAAVAGGGAASSTSSTSGSGLGLSLSCADAYKTLASHRHFDEAADDIGSWLPKLRAVPIPPHRHGGRGHVSAGRAPIEVEAASIMSVLKGFDVRFGRGE